MEPLGKPAKTGLHEEVCHFKVNLRNLPDR